MVTINRETAGGPTETVILKAKDKITKELNLEGAEMEILLQDSSMKAASGGSAPISVTIKGPDLGVLRRMADEIQLMLRGVRGVEGIKSSMALPSFETRVSIDKDRSSAYNLSVSEIARAALIGIRGFVATYLKEEGKEYPVRVRLREQYRNEPSAIRRISIRSPQGVMVPLGDVATITGERGPSEIQRIDQQRAVTISAQVFGRSTGEAAEEVDRKLEPYRSTKDYTVELGGARKEAQESFGGLLIAFVFAIVLTYMIMAAGFESLFHPFLIMMTVPLGVIGVAFTVLVTFIPLSAPVWLAIVLLGGIVVNNGIVLIDHVNELRSGQGVELYAAVVKGCINRLQPVLMTALVAVLSLLPSAIAWGEGTEMSAPMAMATLGGLFISTPLTLVIIPILYYRSEKRILEKNAAKAAESQEP
jgi:HAE1 family hydrophobic/amphiphilic exporter-1